MDITTAPATPVNNIKPVDRFVLNLLLEALGDGDEYQTYTGTMSFDRVLNCTGMTQKELLASIARMRKAGHVTGPRHADDAEYIPIRLTSLAVTSWWWDSSSDKLLLPQFDEVREQYEANQKKEAEEQAKNEENWRMECERREEAARQRKEAREAKRQKAVQAAVAAALASGQKPEQAEACAHHAAYLSRHRRV